MFRSGYFLACVVMFTVLFEMISGNTFVDDIWNTKK